MSNTEEIKNMFDELDIGLALRALNHGPSVFHLKQERNGDHTLLFFCVRGSREKCSFSANNERLAILFGIQAQCKHDPKVVDRYMELVKKA